MVKQKESYQLLLGGILPGLLCDARLWRDQVAGLDMRVTAASGYTVTQTVTSWDDDDLIVEDGTPIEGVVVAVAPPLPAVEGAFVAGEIDVPAVPARGERGRDRDTPAIEITSASPIVVEPDPDSGQRTPPADRR